MSFIKKIKILIALLNKKTYVLDDAYMHILMVYGICTYLIILIASYLLNKKLLIEKQYILLSIWLVLYFYGFSETGLFKIQFNSFLIILSYIVYNKRLDIEEEIIHPKTFNIEEENKK